VQTPGGVPVKLLEYKRPSTYLIVLALVLLCLGFVMAFYVHATVVNLEYDAKIINETGVIRGSIQRVTKLVLSDSAESPDAIFNDINRLFDHFISESNGNGHNGVYDAVFHGIVSLREEWHSLEVLLIEFRAKPTRQMELEIVAESELCWEAADLVVLTAQFAAEGKVGNFSHFYRIIVLNAVTAILVVLHVVLYVRKKLEFELSHDSLTGLYNRRFYDGIIQSEIARSTRFKSKLSLILFDVDSFKQVNDLNGHRIGDRVLAELAEIVKNTVRQTDMVFRVGGDEFAVVCPGTDFKGVFQLAEKIRKRIEQHSALSGIVYTVSLGVTEFQTGVSPEEFFCRADQALYSAKNAGRNRTEIRS
jgi:diguanylate cyclase (GGDEF)-like protein